LTITTYAGLAITSSSTSETYVGASYSHTVTTSESGATIYADTSSIAGLGVTWSSPSLSGTFSSAAVSNGSPFYNEYQILFTANATVGGLPAAASQSHTITIYAALAFLSAPTISDVTVMTEGLMGTLTAGVSGAISLSVDWGDGIVDPVDVDGSDTLLFASHEYAEAGSYTAKIIAINDFGETKSFAVLLAEGEEGWCGCECEACIMSEDCDGSECEEGCECRCCVPAEVGDDDSEDRGTVFWAFVTIGIILLIVGVFLLSKKHPLFGIALILIGALLLVQTLVLDIVETIKDLIGVKS
ncbi:MAG: hypothetical protein FWG19_00115, partial [Methanomassiliicoccaceae archaeon]|nr:hypothetical protein [Methanomassiliicoccaceae archaeon]